jgi:hypothetical protein
MVHESIPEISSLSRIRGSDILLAGCPASLVILKLDKVSSTFTILSIYEDLACEKLTTQLFFEKHLYGFGQGNLLKFEYDRALDNKTFYKMEHCWIDRKKKRDRSNSPSKKKKKKKKKKC